MAAREPTGAILFSSSHGTLTAADASGKFARVTSVGSGQRDYARHFFRDGWREVPNRIEILQAARDAADHARTVVEDLRSVSQARNLAQQYNAALNGVSTVSDTSGYTALDVFRAQLEARINDLDRLASEGEPAASLERLNRATEDLAGIFNPRDAELVGAMNELHELNEAVSTRQRFVLPASFELEVARHQMEAGQPLELGYLDRPAALENLRAATGLALVPLDLIHDSRMMEEEGFAPPIDRDPLNIALHLLAGAPRIGYIDPPGTNAIDLPRYREYLRSIFDSAPPGTDVDFTWLGWLGTTHPTPDIEVTYRRDADMRWHALPQAEYREDQPPGATIPNINVLLDRSVDDVTAAHVFDFSTSGDEAHIVTPDDLARFREPLRTSSPDAAIEERTPVPSARPDAGVPAEQPIKDEPSAGVSDKRGLSDGEDESHDPPEADASAEQAQLASLPSSPGQSAQQVDAQVASSMPGSHPAIGLDPNAQTSDAQVASFPPGAPSTVGHDGPRPDDSQLASFPPVPHPAMGLNPNAQIADVQFASFAPGAQPAIGLNPNADSDPAHLASFSPNANPATESVSSQPGAQNYPSTETPDQVSCGAPPSPPVQPVAAQNSVESHPQGVETYADTD